ncbi:uncharacterized protein LOC111246298 isoform X2 [Varroa destructor]|uniref:Caveolin n=1 Tax=Varroa destructor TaxID=109461 RepID=A0A7M7JJL2_VARDE|nr:uncharacterized protein LOC111246298 isoform X2 [Varroa destructor]
MPPPNHRSSTASSTAPSIKTAIAVKSAVKSFASTAAAAKANANLSNSHNSYANATTHGSNNKVGPKKDAANLKKTAEEKMSMEKLPAPTVAYGMPRDIVEEMPRLPSSTTSIMSLTKDAPGSRFTVSNIGRPVHRSEYLKLTLEELIAEPDQYKTVPQVWSLATKVFGVTKDITYKFRINMFAIRQSLRIILDSVVGPCISELGLIFSRMSIEHKNYQEIHRI